MIVSAFQGEDGEKRLWKMFMILSGPFFSTIVFQSEPSLNFEWKTGKKWSSVLIWPLLQLFLQCAMPWAMQHLRVLPLTCCCQQKKDRVFACRHFTAVACQGQAKVHGAMNQITCGPHLSIIYVAMDYWVVSSSIPLISHKGGAWTSSWP